MKLISEHKGHRVKIGSTTGTYSNPYKIWDNGDEIIVEMFDNKGLSFFFDYKDVKKVLLVKTSKGNRATWYTTRTGTTTDGTRDLIYVCCRNSQKMIYLHAFLMDHIGHGKGNKSVDHIDQDPLNNRRSNLRIISQSEQNKNKPKRSRKKNARPLPDGLVQTDLPKYVIYYYEKQNNDLGYRDHFKIEKHPVIKNKWSTTKSMKISIRDKLKLAIEKLNA